MAISNAYARAAQAQGRSAQSKFKMQTEEFDTKMDIQDIGERTKIYEGIVSSAIKVKDLAKDFNELGKTKQQMQFGMDIYNQLNPDNPMEIMSILYPLQKTTDDIMNHQDDLFVFWSKDTFDNYKQLGKSIFDIRSDVMTNEKGIEFNEGDLTAIAKYATTNKKFDSITEMLDEKFADKETEFKLPELREQKSALDILLGR